MAKKRGNGEGSITYRKKEGRYMARYTVHTASGPKRKTIYGRTRAEVAAKLAKAMVERNSGFHFDAEDMAVAEYLRGCADRRVANVSTGDEEPI